MIKYIDLTKDINSDMIIYFEDSKTELKKMKDIDIDKYSYYKLEIGLHTGTHIDTPLHMLKFKKHISEYTLDQFIGKGVVINAKDQKIVFMKEEYESIIVEKSIVLVYTGFNESYDKYPIIDERFCDFLIKRKIKILGVDTPSPDNYPFLIHNKLFKNDICIIENLINLEKLLEYDDIEIFAIPLKIDSDSSIARVFAKITC